MVNEIYGTKIGMTQIFDENGVAIPVTAIEAKPLTVVAKKTADKDGYNAIVVSFGDVKEKNVNKPRKGLFAKAGVEVQRHLREIKVENVDEYEQKVKDSKVLSKDMDNIEDLWDMVLCITEDQVQWDQQLLQVEYSKVKNYQDTWEAKLLQY